MGTLSLDTQIPNGLYCPDTKEARIYEGLLEETQNDNQTCTLRQHRENRLRVNLDGSLEIIPKSPAFVFGEKVIGPAIDFSKSVFEGARDITIYAYNFFSGKSYENLVIQKHDLEAKAEQLQDDWSLEKIKYDSDLIEIKQMLDTLDNQITFLQSYKDLAHSHEIFSSDEVSANNLLKNLIKSRDHLLQEKFQLLDVIKNIEHALSEIGRINEETNTKFEDYESFIKIFELLRTSIRKNLNPRKDVLNFRKDVKREIKRV